MDDRYGYRADYPLFKLPSPLSSQSDYFDEGLDDGSLNDLVDTVDRNHKYPSNQYQELPSQGNDQQFTSSPDRDYIPAPQARRNSSNRIHSTEFQDRYDSPCIYPDDTIMDEDYQESYDLPVGYHNRQISDEPFPNLIPVTDLPAPHRVLFEFTHFNSVQSECFPTVYRTNHNVLTNAPTGSGKTVLFELAILRMLEYNQSSKAVYMAPTKSLCAERFQDWSRRFDPLGITCVELTGDSENAGLADAKLANLIITTPEKWDSMTRRWFEFTKLLNNLRLVCIDEVHMLNEERGSVLEVIVARMKTLGTNIRLIALSATVPNISDVAEWLGDGGVADQNQKALPGQAPAKTFIFGEEHRPVKLSKFVYGYSRRPEHTEYQFMSLLNYKLMDHIVTHSSKRPTLVFCGTRKSSLQAAEALSKAYQKMSTQGDDLPWEAPRSAGTFSDKKLTELGSQGIGIHHAGLDHSDRRQVESLFASNQISVLCTTSTLAVGVNLPARCVIIRGTKTYRGGAAGRDGFEDYSELDLIQMMGRAGRPQFDDEGVAVVMTSQNDKMRIEKLVKSETMLESCLHLNLTEHINSEIYMGTITSRSSAIAWLENSFLAVRIKKNAKHYSISDDQIAPDKQLANFAEAALDLLAQDGLIEEDEDHLIRPTELGEIMSKFCLRHKTFLGLARMKSSATMRNLLEIVSGADEYSTLRLRTGEGVAYKTLNSHPELKCSIPGKVTQTWQKVMLLIQAVLGGIPLAEVKVENTNPVMEVNIIWQHLPRICKCLVSLAIARHDSAVKNCLELLRSVTAKAWDDSPWVMRQLDQIGEKSVKRLVDSGISTIDKLQNTSNHRIELILDRNPPFGTRIVRQARSMPKFYCTMEKISEAVVPEGVHVCVGITVGLSDTGEPPVWKWKNYMLMATVLVMTNDQEWIEFRTIQVKLLRETKQFDIECILVKPSQTIVTHVACTQLAGIGTSTRWKPHTLREHYPKPKTITDDEAASLEVLEGLDTKDLAMSSGGSECEVLGKQSKPKATSSNQSLCQERKTAKVPKLHPKNNNLTHIGAAENKRPDSGAGERLKNGRFRCAHRCKGACSHICCRDGVTKPPKIREPKKTSSANSTNPQNSRLPNSLPVNPIRTTNITRTAEDWRRIREAVPGSSTKSNQPKLSGRIRPIKKVVAARRFDSDDNLPSLEELEEISIGESEEKQPEHKDKTQIVSPDAENSLQNRPCEKLTLPEESNLVPKAARRPTGPTSMEKFRNMKKIVEDFDERGIFRQRKDVSSPPCVAPPTIAEDELPQQKGSPTPSPSPRLNSPTPERNCVDQQISQVLSDGDETDELDEDWDLKIFEGYLAPASQEGGAIEESTKRRVDQLDISPSIPTPKKLKPDAGNSLKPSPDAEEIYPELGSNMNRKGDGHAQDQRENAEHQPFRQTPSTGDKEARPESDQGSHNDENDELDSDDSVMGTIDKVLAWAESHVVEE
ncbi:hypothetical protein Pst134EB_018149 [Puccinia striiformis f. sp. tritici]|uniref:DNA 3'-5' helicase n=1 Tax=Puccinia striiformis f. sp. tritici PST-78 TaxID=1165861 RepID=A0A0L0UTP1_9BASI|nr:hypothetical protein Pst134EB_018149 [Puccinia striiformis f. sp. tritici]KNE90089.1 hypothetical protein PSTG_16466 [Puccinia striiformis f. sp. tritici PST-78]